MGRLERGGDPQGAGEFHRELELRHYLELELRHYGACRPLRVGPLIGPTRAQIDQFSMFPRQPPLSWPVDSIIVLNDSRSPLTLRSSDPIMLPTDSFRPSGS